MNVRWAVWGIPALLIVASSLAIRATSSPLQRLLIFLGDASYAIYLTHPFVMLAYATVLKKHENLIAVSQLPFVPLIVFLSIACGALAHIMIERPLTALVRGLFWPQKPIAQIEAAHAR